MKNQASADTRQQTADAQTVVEYLTENPAFFETYPELLGTLQMSHDSGGAASLVERQVQVLREQNQALKTRLDELIEVARNNDELSKRMHRLSLAVVSADSAQALLDIIHRHFSDDIQADAFTLHLRELPDDWGTHPDIRPLEVTESLRSLFALAFEQNQTECGRLKQAQLDVLFGSQSEHVASAIVAPLGSGARFGLIAAGSRQASRFNPCLGTLFMDQLAELIAAAMQRHLESARH